MIWMLLFSAVITAINVTLIYMTFNSNLHIYRAMDKKLQEYKKIKASIPAIVPSLDLQKKINEFDLYFEEVEKTLKAMDLHLADKQQED